MSLFVHLTSEKNAKSIQRHGIRFEKVNGYRLPYIYAMPVTRNFLISHQWLRELKRSGQRTFVGVYFRLPDDEQVLVSHYNTVAKPMTAAQAVALLMGIEGNDPQAARERDRNSRGVKSGHKLPASPEGYQVMIQRPIAAREILKIRALPQLLGWRYSPGAHGKAPVISLPMERGAYGVTKLRKRVEDAERRGIPTNIRVFGR